MRVVYKLYIIIIVWWSMLMYSIGLSLAVNRLKDCPVVYRTMSLVRSVNNLSISSSHVFFIQF